MIPAELALLAWPVVGIALVYWLGATTGVTVSILGGLMLLPEAIGFDLPLLPPITKYEIVSISAGLGLLLAYPRRVTGSRASLSTNLLILLVLGSAFATALANRDSLPGGAQPLTLYDGLSMAIRDLTFLCIPFLIGRFAHRSPADLQRLLRVWFLTAIVASLFALLEVRLTPFLHEWVYGYRARNLSQEFRWGGARPMLLMPNGLALSMFFSIAVVCAGALSRARGARERGMHIAAAVYLSVLLVLSRSLASMLYGISGAAAAVFARSRTQLLIAVALAGIGVAYPITRSMGVVTGQSVVALAAEVSAERAQSFDFRLLNEDALIEFVKPRLMLGFGTFGKRNRFLNEATNRGVITDGYWIILLTGRGAIGLGLTFALLVLPVVRAWRRGRRYALVEDRAAVAGVAMVLSLQIVDLLPNGLFSFLPFYVAGALWGATGMLPAAGAPPPLPPNEATTRTQAVTKRRSLASLAGSRRRRS